MDSVREQEKLAATLREILAVGAAETPALGVRCVGRFFLQNLNANRPLRYFLK